MYDLYITIRQTLHIAEILEIETVANLWDRDKQSPLQTTSVRTMVLGEGQAFFTDTQIVAVYDVAQTMRLAPLSCEEINEIALSYPLNSEDHPVIFNIPVQAIEMTGCGSCCVIS